MFGTSPLFQVRLLMVPQSIGYNLCNGLEQKDDLENHESHILLQAKRIEGSHMLAHGVGHAEIDSHDILKKFRPRFGTCMS
jgi:hypothetical protein